VRGPQAATEFLAGYVIEKSLSVDNIFVFVLIFSYFAVPPQYESRILMWGILGALVMRGAFVVAGAALLAAFHWMTYVFGALLIATGLKLVLKSDAADVGGNPVVRLARRFLRCTDRLDGQRFFACVDGKVAATPLFLVLVVVETTDLIFAVDSIPAIFAITRDPFVVYTSNVFAVLGLRSLYFLVAHLVTAFRFLKYGLVLILWFVGAKLLLTGVVKIPIGVSLAVIGGILAASIAVSLLRPART
jgi:tellurite resistance protein TerC